MTDEIIQEVWSVKDFFAKAFNYDVEALAAEMRRRQEKSDRKIVDLSKESAQQARAADGPPRTSPDKYKDSGRAARR